MHLLHPFVTLASLHSSSRSGSSWASVELTKSILRRSKFLLAFIGITVLLIGTLCYWEGPAQIKLDVYHESWGSRVVPTTYDALPEYCYDPYRLPGYIERSELPEGPIESVTYVASNPSVKGRVGRPNGVNNLNPFTVPTISSKLLTNPDEPGLEFLRNRTVLFIGDSLDRNEVYHMAEETFGPQSHRFLTDKDTPEVSTPALESHRIGMSVHPKLRFTIANWFLMSVDLEEPRDFFYRGQDYPQPFEGRFAKFYEPLIEKGHLTRYPDMVVFNSGLWDLVYLSNLKDFEIDQNRTKGIPTKLQVTGEELLTTQEIEFHTARFTKFIHKLVYHTFNQTRPIPHIRNQGPLRARTRFVYRTMPDSSYTLAKSNTMSRKRVRQMDQLNIKIIQDFNHAQTQSSGREEKVLVDILDWRWAANQLLDELTDLVHFGRGAAQWLYGDMVLYHLRRHVIEEKLRQDRRANRKSEISSILWAECSRYTSLISSLNRTGSFKLPQSRSVFNP